MSDGLYSVKKCLIDSLSVLSEVEATVEEFPLGRPHADSLESTQESALLLSRVGVRRAAGVGRRVRRTPFERSAKRFDAMIGVGASHDLPHGA